MDFFFFFFNNCWFGHNFTVHPRFLNKFSSHEGLFKTFITVWLLRFLAQLEFFLVMSQRCQMYRCTKAKPQLISNWNHPIIQNKWCVWLYTLGSLTWTSSNLKVRWTLPPSLPLSLSRWILPWRARWSTLESCSRHPVWPWAQCRSAFSGRPGGCCWCTFSPRCWVCLGSKGILGKDRKREHELQPRDILETTTDIRLCIRYSWSLSQIYTDCK